MLHWEEHKCILELNFVSVGKYVSCRKIPGDSQHDSREGRVPKNNESALNKIVSMKYERGKTFLS